MKKAVALIIVIVFVLSGIVVGFVANGYLGSPNLPSKPSQSETTQPSPSGASTDNLITPSSPPEGSIVVPDDYPTIHAAVAAASDGQAIYVRAGQYNESVAVTKSVWLIGEAGAQIDANSVAADITVSHDNVNVTGFTLQNTPTPPTGTWLEQMQGIGGPVQHEDIILLSCQHCNIYSNSLKSSLVGVQLQNASQNTVAKNNFSDNSGLVLHSSMDNIVQGNVFDCYGMALRLENAAGGNNILDNTITNATYAIYIDSSSSNTLRNNTLTHNFRSFCVTGNSASDYLNTVDNTNLIDSKPICYLIGQSGGTVPSGAGAVVLVNCVNMVVKNSILPLSTTEITLVNTNNSLVKANAIALSDSAQLSAGYTPQPPMHIFLYRCFNNNLEDNWANIVMNYSDSNTLTGNHGVMSLTHSNNNQITSNQVTVTYFDVLYATGIQLSASSGNIIKQNNITSNTGSGIIATDGASNNLIAQNTISGNVGGVIVTSNQQNMFNQVDVSDPTMPTSNVIYGNVVSGNQNQGILDSGYCTQIVGNTFTKNGNCGLELRDSQNTTIIGNSIDGIFFGVMGNNTRNVQVIANSITLNNKFTSYCLWLVSAYPVTFYHNNFYGQVNFSHYADNYMNSTISDAAASIWDNGNQGNYWSSYSGVDLDGNGIGDTPYPLGFGYYDNYPLTSPFDISSAIPAAPA
jgi:parallel beta-helix repeat (two copies)